MNDYYTEAYEQTINGAPIESTTFPKRPAYRKTTFCPDCGGSGLFWKYNKNLKKIIFIECKTCKGSGEIKEKNKK